MPEAVSSKIHAPGTPEELAEMLGHAADQKQTITVRGQGTKNLMAGPVERSDISITTAALNRVLKYEPRDLTISVEAGMPYAELVRLLARNGQMVPLDPPFSETATVGGVIATNSSGPRRRLYGTARDLVIGMKFATLEGKVVQSGGMVVKNVAGLDMGKLMIGSFGTLAAMAVVNFKLTPKPAIERTILVSFETQAEAVDARDRVIRGVLQPEAMDLLNPLVSAQLGYKGWILALQFGGNEAVISRYQSEIAALGQATRLSDADEAKFWGHVQNLTPRFVAKFSDGVVVRVSCTLAQLRDVMESFEGPAVARAGSGICYGYFSRSEAAVKWMAAAGRRQWRAVIEFCAEPQQRKLDLWPAPGGDFEMMKKVKQMFDPHHLLNRGRLYRLL